MAGSTEAREIAVPKYFIKTPQAPTPPAKPEYSKIGPAALIIGGILAFIGLLITLTIFSEGGFTSLCIGPIVLGFGVWLALRGRSGNSAKKTEYEKTLKQHEEDMKAYEKAYAKAEPKPSDQQMDDWLSGDIVKLKKEALHKLDLTPEQVVTERGPDRPLIVQGPELDADAAIGADNYVRFSKYGILIVYLTDYHLAAYQCILDMAQGIPISENTREYHYADILSVATQATNNFQLTINGEKTPIKDYQRFELAVTSAHHISVAVSLQLKDLFEKGQLAPTGADEAIKVIRARLREKKGGMHVNQPIPQAAAAVAPLTTPEDVVEDRPSAEDDDRVDLPSL